MNHSYLYIILAIAVALLIFIVIWKYFFSVKGNEAHIKAQTKLLNMIEKARKVINECRERLNVIKKKL